MISCIEQTAQWKTYTSSQNIDDLVDALKQAFMDIDKSIRDVQNTTTTGDSSGCTANTAMITPTHILCANAGDSRCVLSTKKGLKTMSSDHKPSGAAERKRIEAAGGIVHRNRVDGDLAVSRTLGDFAYKQRFDLPPEKQKVSCEPDIVCYQRDDSNDEFIILACDGLWDVMSNEDAVGNVRHIQNLGESNPMLIAEEMTDIALEKGAAYKIEPLRSTIYTDCHGIMFVPCRVE